MLTLAGIIGKLLGAMYRIPLQNLTGDLGFYTYQQIYPILAAATIMSLYGFPAAVSRLSKEEMVKGNDIYHPHYIRSVFFMLFMICGGFGVLLFALAPFIARLMQDEWMVFPLQLSAALFLFLPFISLVRGLSQAELKAEATAYSQLMEQVFRVAIIIFGSWLVFRGLLHVRSIATVGVIASMAGMTLSTIVLWFFFVRQKRSAGNIPGSSTINWRTYLKTMLTFGLIASLNHLSLILLQFVDALTLVPQLMKLGFTPLSAMEQKGIYDRGIPLIQIGVVLGSSFALMFVPTVVEKHKRNQLKRIRDAFSVCIYLALGATAGLIVLFPEVNRLLFMDDQQTAVLQILALSIIFLSISITGSAILLTSDYASFTVVSLVVAVMLKWLLNVILVPIWGTYGGALATAGSLFILAAMILYGIYKKLSISPLSFIPFIPPAAATSMMVIYLYAVKCCFQAEAFSRLHLLFYVSFLIVSGAFLYLTVLIRFDALNKRQLLALPLKRWWFSIYTFFHGKR